MIHFYRNLIGPDWSIYINFHWFYIRIGRCTAIISDPWYKRVRISINK